MNVSLIFVVALSLTLVPCVDCHRCYGKYMCKRGPKWYTRRTCIDKAALCDNNANCPLNDDEEVCSGCPLLDTPMNGNVYMSGLQPGASADYSCDAGFVLSVNTTRTCLDDTSWNGTEPTCDAPYCDFLFGPTNGRSTTYCGQPIPPGCVTEFECDDGYVLSDTRSLVCLENGSWNGTAPTCDAPYCDFLFGPTNGRSITYCGQPIPPGCVTEFECDDGYVLSDTRSLVCLENGSWNGTAPTCDVPEMERKK